ncbi:hypothetical protein GQ43DRAFT_375258 [Delitschia confertaspora ATCC 74209]|uniref:Histone chaperone domain-containing protein n=1 Tax=Delitschia confertaspora ATCC 74209 TaxID=1513339 RepID=A0A9P4MRE0_9PLEO|nr:hypothetical protein GQ43DRAFT_375258 [Delitschia confertaspora ATCC 74209]
MSHQADDKYEQENDNAAGPDGVPQDDSYATEGPIPVQKDDSPVEDAYDPATADSDKQLERDEAEAIDKSNIIKERTRGAAKEPGTYAEPGDEEGMPSPEDGTSSVR